MKRILVGLVTLLLLRGLVTSAAHAAGMEFPENGTRALGRGGAFVAKADDPSAIVLNPAGLTQVKGFNVLFDTNFNFQDLCFNRDGTYPGTPAPYSYAGQPYPRVCRNLRGAYPVPMLSATWDAGLENWTFAIGGYGPHAVGRRKFPMMVTVRDSEGRPVRAPGPTRYHTDDMNIILIYYTAAAAYRPVKWLSLGAAFQLVYTEAHYATWVPLTSTHDPDSDIRFQILTYGMGYTGILSALANPVAGLHLGLSVRLPFQHATRGNAWLLLPPSLSALGNPLVWDEGKKKAELVNALPLAIRSGVRYAWPIKGQPDAPDLADIELDLIWERWSVMVSMDTKLNATLLDSPMEVFALNHFYQDVAEFRLGGSFTIPKKIGPGWLTFRLGTYYGNDASPLAYTRMNYAAWARVGVFAGLSYRIAGIDFHVGFSHIWNGTGKIWRPWSFRSTRHVAASCVQPINAFQSEAPVKCNPTWTDPNSTDPAEVARYRSDISHGTWRGSFTSVSLGFNVRFDELYRTVKRRPKGAAETRP